SRLGSSDLPGRFAGVELGAGWRSGYVLYLVGLPCLAFLGTMVDFSGAVWLGSRNKTECLVFSPMLSALYRWAARKRGCSAARTAGGLGIPGGKLAVHPLGRRRMGR